MDPSDRERSDLGKGAPHGTDRPMHASGTLGEGDRWLRSVVENSLEIVTIVDPDGTLRYTNPAFKRVLGYDPEEAVGMMNVLDYVHPDDLSHVLEETEKALSKGSVVTNEAKYRFRHADGSWRWIESVRTYLLDDPAVGGVVVTSRDVTERKEAEERLRRAEQRYRNLVERVPAVVYVQQIGSSDSAMYMSPRIEDLTGYTPEECKDPDMRWRMVHLEDRERMQAEDERTGEPGEVFASEYRVVHRDGRTVWVRNESVLIEDEEGGSRYWQGFMIDITERKHAEEALTRSEALLAESQRIAHLGTWEWDVETGEVWWSDETYRIHGFAPGEGINLREKVEEAFFPEDLPVYKRKIEEALSGEAEGYDFRHRIRRPDGVVRWVHGQAEVVRGEGGEPLRMIGTVHDVTERKALEERLRHQAFHDPLTDLPNRQLFVDRLGQALRRTRRQQNRVAVLFMDLDGFKVVNDSLGHEIGDLLLTVVAQRLGRCLRPEDSLARFGGDEFVVLIEEVEVTDEAARVAKRITEELRRPFVMDGRELYVIASIGISLGDARTHDPDGLLREADTAMYRAKDEHRNYTVFDPTMYELALGRLELENDLRRAIEREEFVLHYQPVVRLDDDGGVWKIEALVRWDHPERGLLDPDEFVPVAEESGLVVPMGEQVLEQACRRAVEWQRQFPRSTPLVMCVNLSARQLSRPDLAETVERVLGETGMEGGCLSLDVTETVYVSTLEQNTAVLDRLKAMGVEISIDDFGTIYSSLSYLKRLPADAIKIDKSFVKGLGGEVEDTAIVRMIIGLAHTLGMEVIAEGVESEEQARLLKEMGCGFAQGYHFSKPLPPEEIPALLSPNTLT